MDLTISKVALTGKAFKGILQLPLDGVTGQKKHAGITLSVALVAKCEGIFGEEYDITDEFDTNESSH